MTNPTCGTCMNWSKEFDACTCACYYTHFDTETPDLPPDDRFDPDMHAGGSYTASCVCNCEHYELWPDAALLKLANHPDDEVGDADTT